MPSRQYLYVYCIALFFSALSTFNLGFREFNFGRWLRLLLFHEYDFKAYGFTRTVAGVQALVSVYLLALSILSYFGSPFESW